MMCIVHIHGQPFFSEEGAILKGVVDHLKGHRQIEGYLRRSMQKAHRLIQIRKVRQRLMTRTPDVERVDLKFSRRFRAFADASRHLSIPLLTHHLGTPAGYGVGSICAPVDRMSPGSVYRLSPYKSVCVLKTDSNASWAYVAHLYCDKPCKKHCGVCWRYAKGGLTTWIAVDKLGDDLITIAPRFANKKDLKVAVHATCFRVVGKSTPLHRERCQLLVHNVFEAAGTTLVPDDAHMLAALFPVRRFWYMCENGKELDPSRLECGECKKHLRWAGSQMCRTRGLGMTCIFQLLSPKLRCTGCGKTYVAWSPVVRAQLLSNVVPSERLDHVGNLFFGDVCY